MNNPLKKFRKFFVKPKKMNATAVRNTSASSHDDETDDTKLSGAFIVVLILHIVAVVGIVAFTRIKENRRTAEQSAIAPAGLNKNTAAAAPGPSNTVNTKSTQLAPEVPSGDLPPVESNPPRTLPSTGVQVHTVKQGETLTKIAMAFGTSVPELVKMNQLKGPNDLNIGQVLNIPDRNSLPPLPVITERQPETARNSPPKTSTPTATKSTATKTSATGGSYTIKKGDSLMKIARDHSISYEALVKVNKGVDPKKIQPGQVLKIPAKN